MCSWDRACELMCGLSVSSAMSCVNTDPPVLAHSHQSGTPAVGAALVGRPAEVRAPDESVIFGRGWLVCVVVDGFRSLLKNS